MADLVDFSLSIDQIYHKCLVDIDDVPKKVKRLVTGSLEIGNVIYVKTIEPEPHVFDKGKIMEMSNHIWEIVDCMPSQFRRDHFGAPYRDAIPYWMMPLGGFDLKNPNDHRNLIAFDHLVALGVASRCMQLPFHKSDWWMLWDRLPHVKVVGPPNFRRKIKNPVRFMGVVKKVPGLVLALLCLPLLCIIWGEKPSDLF